MKTTRHPHGGNESGDERPQDPVVRHRLIERRDLVRRELLLQRVLAEFREMPCLRLTVEQAGRLLGLDPDVCTRLIEGLARDGLLRVDGEGRYAVTDS